MAFKKLVRFSILSLITSFFLAVAVIAVILAQGNTIDDTGTITQTSIVNISTIPTDVEVLVDNEIATIRDNKIEWINPGIRNLVIRKEGYREWSKEVELRSGVVKNVFTQLIPNALEQTTLTESNIDQIFFSDNSEFAYFIVTKSEDPAQNGLWRLKLSRNFLDFGNNSPILISNLTDTLQFLRTESYNLIIAQDNNKVLLQIPSQSIARIIDLSRLNQDEDIVAELGYYPDNIFWFRNSDSLIVEKSNLLIEFELSSGQKTLVDYSFEDNLLYSVNNDYILYQNTQNKDIYIYSNKSSLLFEEDNITLEKVKLEGLKRLRTIRGSRDIVVFEYENSIIYVNLDKRFYEELAGVTAIKKISNNGSLLLLERGGRLISYILESAPNNIDLEGNEYLWEGMLSKDVSKIYITPNNRNFILEVTKEDSYNYLVFADNDGKNRSDLLGLVDRFVNGANYITSFDSTKLYVLVDNTVEEVLSGDVEIAEGSEVVESAEMLLKESSTSNPVRNLVEVSLTLSN